MVIFKSNVITEQALEQWVNHQVEMKLTEALSHAPSATRYDADTVEKLQEFAKQVQQGLRDSQKNYHEAQGEVAELRKQVKKLRGENMKLLQEGENLKQALEAKLKESKEEVQKLKAASSATDMGLRLEKAAEGMAGLPL